MDRTLGVDRSSDLALATSAIASILRFKLTQKCEGSLIHAFRLSWGNGI